MEELRLQFFAEEGGPAAPEAGTAEAVSTAAAQTGTERPAAAPREPVGAEEVLRVPARRAADDPEAYELRRPEEEQLREQSDREEELLRREFRLLTAQAEEARKLYPELSLTRELRDPRFAQLTRNGVDVRTAYEVVHHAELREAEMRYAADRRAAELSRAIRSGSRRPDEAGLGSLSGRAPVGMDPARMSREQREEVRRRVRAGERITF